MPFVVFIFLQIHLRFPSISNTAPLVDSGTHMTTDSIGSRVFPFSSWKITCGAPTWSSNPSRRIVSMRTERWSSHRPETMYPLSSPHSKSICSPTFISSSFSRRSRICLDVTNFPSLPANGESFTMNSILSVGASIVIAGIASTFGSEPTVSQT